MENTKLRQSLRSKDTKKINESKSAKRIRGRPQNDDICDTSTDHEDLPWFQDDAEKLRQSHKYDGLSPLAKARSLRPRIGDIYDPSDAHKVTTRSQINKNEREAKASVKTTRSKNKQEPTLNDSTEMTTSDDSSEEDPSDASDVSLQVKNRNLLEGPKAIPSLQPKQSLTQLFNCDDCGAHFLTRRARNNHVICKRHDQQLYTCEKCNFKYTKLTLGKHVKIHHLRLGLGRENFEVIKQVKINHYSKISSQLFKCDVCGAHFLTRRTGNRHVKRKGHAKKLIPCEKCKFKFTSRTLDKHIEIHHRRLELRRENFEVIQLHKITHIYEKSSQLFKCEVCSANFLTRTSLDIHVKRKRHIMQLIPCEKCKFKFTSRTLFRHITIHHHRQELRRENFEVIRPYFSETKLNRRHGNKNQDRISSINKEEAPNVSPDQRINEVMCKENNIEKSSNNEETEDLKKSGVNSKGTNSFSDPHNVEASISHNKFYDTTLNEGCVPKHMRCRVVIENAMVENVNRYIIRKTVHSNGNKTSEPVYPSLEDGNPKMSHNDVCDDVVVGYLYGGLSIKIDSEDKDIVLNLSHDGPENEKLSKINVKDEVEHSEVEMGVQDKSYPDMNDEIYFVKDEVEDVDETNIDDIDVPDDNGPEIKIYKVECSDPVLMSVQTGSVTAKNNDVSVKIKDVFSIQSIEIESQATGETTSTIHTPNKTPPTKTPSRRCVVAPAAVRTER